MFPAEVVIISVHSAKFPAEKLTANIRAAVMRHGIAHPVVNDADLDVWSQYSVRAWPTVVLVDPAGKVVGQQSGEIEATALGEVIAAMIADFDGQGLLNRTPIAGLQPEIAKAAQYLLSFPSKLLYAVGDRLFIADTGHQRILEVQLSTDGFSGEIVRIFGSGEPSWQDGSIQQARFHDPHGMALVGATLYVADTENHAIRAIHKIKTLDPTTGQVQTLIGTGQPGTTDGPFATAQLYEPEGLVVAEGKIYIADTNNHLIRVADLKEKRVSTLGIK